MSPDISLLGAKWFIILALILKRVDIKRRKVLSVARFSSFYFLCSLYTEGRTIVVGTISN